MARGINVAADILTRTADGVDLNVLWNEFSAALDEWNAGRDAITALFTSPTTDSFALLPNGGDTFEIEKASQFGVPQAKSVSPNQLRMGFPLDWTDARTAYTRQYLRDASAEQVRAQHAGFLNADNRYVFREIMGALTRRPADVASRPANENGVPIFSLWDGLGDYTPPTYAGKSFTSNHNHYLVSGAATVDGGDLKQLTDTIQEHGYGLRQSNEQVIIMVHPDDADVIRTFRHDPANEALKPYDFIPSVSAPAYLTDKMIVGDKAPALFNQLPIEGSYGDAWITKNFFIPKGYLIAVATAGANAARNPLWFREHVNAGLRGFRLLPTYERYPLIDAVYERGMGVGVRHRSAAAVMQIKASGSYVDPTFA